MKTRLTLAAIFLVSMAATHPALALNPQPLPPRWSHGFFRMLASFFGF